MKTQETPNLKLAFPPTFLLLFLKMWIIYFFFFFFFLTLYSFYLRRVIQLFSGEFNFFIFFFSGIFFLLLFRRGFRERPRDVNNNTLGSAHANIKTAQKSNNIYTTFCGIIKHTGASLMQREWEQKRRKTNFFYCYYYFILFPAKRTWRRRKAKTLIEETFFFFLKRNI